jgi:hypothetical protein
VIRKNDRYQGTRAFFLGMKFTFNGDGTVSVCMKSYLEEAIEESNLGISSHASTPAKKDLFSMDESSPLLEKEETERFHSVVAKLLYIATRARPDILLAISFYVLGSPIQQDKIKISYEGYLSISTGH